jgi:hypothetical protein
LVGEPERRSVVSYRQRWEDNITNEMGCGLDSSGPGQCTVAGPCELSGTIKGEEFLDELVDYQFLKEDLPSRN